MEVYEEIERFAAHEKEGAEKAKAQDWMSRYQAALQKIGVCTFLELPESVKVLLKQTTSLSKKVILLEAIAEHLSSKQPEKEVMQGEEENLF